MDKSKALIQGLLVKAGFTINGPQPWDIHISNEAFYDKVLYGSLGLGESFMDGDWQCDRVDEFINRLIPAHLENEVKKSLKTIAHFALSKFINYQSMARSRSDIQDHYDIGDDVYENMLDPEMIYTCGYWKDATTLEQAQQKKMRLACEKMYLKPGMKILDIGCGWGGFAKFASTEYGVDVTGVTNSTNQAKAARKRCEGLNVTIIEQDYRDITGSFDRIVSFGMFEHVGPKNHRPYMEVVDRCLKEDGLFLLHCIGGHTSVTTTDPWIEKHVFPGTVIPSPVNITTAVEGLFKHLDWHCFGKDYDRTLMAWYENFVKNWPNLKDKYNDRFYLKWIYYLLMCAGSFRCGYNDLWQIVFSKIDSPIEYVSIR